MRRRQNGTEVVASIVVAAALLTCICLMERGEAVWLTLPKVGHKCVSEEIRHNVVVFGEYVVTASNITHQPTLTIKVTSPDGSVLHENKTVIGGNFAFTTKEDGKYFACFWVDRHHNHHQFGEVIVDLDWKIGFAAKDWDSFARKEKIEGVELQLKKLEEAVDWIHENLLSLGRTEMEMRIVSERTNSRVARYSIMSLGICIVASALQLWHLKQFFQKRKLI